MNAMDIYDFGEGGHTTSPPASSGNVPAATAGIDSQPATRQPSLNEEVQQALGSLGSWWGGFRKQVSDGARIHTLRPVGRLATRNSLFLFLHLTVG